MDMVRLEVVYIGIDVGTKFMTFLVSSFGDLANIINLEVAVESFINNIPGRI